MLMCSHIILLMMMTIITSLPTEIFGDSEMMMLVVSKDLATKNITMTLTFPPLTSSLSLFTFNSGLWSQQNGT